MRISLRLAAAGALTAGALTAAVPSASAAPVITGGLVNVTVVDALDVNNNQILNNVGVGVAANVQAAVCGIPVGVAVLSIVGGIAQGPVECTNTAGNQTVTIEQVTRR